MGMGRRAESVPWEYGTSVGQSPGLAAVASGVNLSLTNLFTGVFINTPLTTTITRIQREQCSGMLRTGCWRRGGVSELDNGLLWRTLRRPRRVRGGVCLTADPCCSNLQRTWGSPLPDTPLANGASAHTINSTMHTPGNTGPGVAKMTFTVYRN